MATPFIVIMYLCMHSNFKVYIHISYMHVYYLLESEMTNYYIRSSTLKTVAFFLTHLNYARIVSFPSKTIEVHPPPELRSYDKVSSIHKAYNKTKNK